MVSLAVNFKQNLNKMHLSDILLFIQSYAQKGDLKLDFQVNSFSLPLDNRNWSN